VQKYINEGSIYVSGRDCRFRPILLIKAEYIDEKTFEIDSFLKTLTYVLEYTMNFLMCPFHIENYIFIIDANFIGVKLLSVKYYSP